MVQTNYTAATTYHRPKANGFSQVYNRMRYSITTQDVTFIANTYFALLLVTNGTTFVTGRLYVPLGVCTVTTRTFPSGPGCTSFTCAKVHFIGATCSPRMQMMSPTFRLGDDVFHLANCCNWHNYSLDQWCQKCCTIFWHKCQRCTKDTDRDIWNRSGMASRGRPIRK